MDTFLSVKALPIFWSSLTAKDSLVPLETIVPTLPVILLRFQISDQTFLLQESLP